MKRFLLTFTTALVAFVGCQMPDLAFNKPAEQTPQYWAPVISSAAGLALPQVVVTPDPAPVNKVKRSQCTVCGGTGRIRTGDGISWTECDNCVPDATSMVASLDTKSQAELEALRAYRDAMEAWLRNKGLRPDPFAITSKLDSSPAAGIVPDDGVSLLSPSSGYTTYSVCGPNGCSTRAVPQRRGLFGWRRW